MKPCPIDLKKTEESVPLQTKEEEEEDRYFPMWSLFKPQRLRIKLEKSSMVLFFNIILVKTHFTSL
jgi:hypothetical protein